MPIFGLGVTELALILVIVVVLFGANRLPKITKAVSEALKEFKSGLKK